MTHANLERLTESAAGRVRVTVWALGAVTTTFAASDWRTVAVPSPFRMYWMSVAGQGLRDDQDNERWIWNRLRQTKNPAKMV